MNLVRKGVLAVTLAASALAISAPAQARDYYRHRGGGDDAAIAIGAGVIGLAIGAAIASDHDDRVYYNDGYYPRGYYYNEGYTYPRYRSNYYYNSYPVYREYYRGDNGWRGHDRGRRWEHERYEHDRDGDHDRGRWGRRGW